MLHKGNILSELQRMKKVVQKIPYEAGLEGEKFFKRGFQLGAWQGDTGNQPWDKRKYDDTERGVLLGAGTANLMKGLRKQVMGFYVMVKVTGVATKYADIHNFGGTIKQRVTRKQKKWAWAMFYRTKSPFYKAMALSETLTIKMPKRKFIGQTRQLDVILDKLFTKRFSTFK